MQYKYDTDVVIQAIEMYLLATKDEDTPDDCMFHERVDVYREYETLIRLANPPSSVILDEYELDLLAKYL